MTITNPFHDQRDETEQSDAELVRMSQEGHQKSLELLITRHQSWIYNIALRMVSHPEDAEDITQEVLIKVITKLSTFQGKSQFRTWLYRIVKNHVLNIKTKRVEKFVTTFQQYGDDLDQIQNVEPTDTLSVSPEFNVILEETKLACIHGMLLCLSREQRFIYILGCIFHVGDKIGSEIMELSRDNFRQKIVTSASRSP